MLTVERLKELLHYDPETGVFTWVEAPTKWKPYLVGARAGCVDTDGYRQIKIDKEIYIESRLAFLYMNGALPTHMAEHKNRDILDNRWCNLREATNSQNQANSKIKSTNTTGIKGVRHRIGPRHRWGDCWVAQIKVNGFSFHLGSFKTKEEAAECYRAAQNKVFGEYARVE